MTFRLSTVSFSAVCLHVPKPQSGAHVLRSDGIRSKVGSRLKRDSREQLWNGTNHTHRKDVIVVWNLLVRWTWNHRTY